MQGNEIDLIAQATVDAAVTKFADRNLKPEQIGLSVGVWDDKGLLRSGGYASDVEMYPASVVKLFYLVYLSHLLDTKKIIKTAEIERAANDMIVESDNDATNWILEVITGAYSGPELSPRSLRAWMDKRQAVNRYFKKLGYSNLNVSQKTWYSGPYGRERQGYGKDWEHRNSLSPSACVRLMVEIMTDQAASKERCVWMRSLMSRHIPADSDKADAQSKGYSGEALPSGAMLWSKAGWTSTVRHDVAAVQLKDGKRYVWAIFTKGQSNTEQIVPFLAGQLLERLERL